MKKTVLLMKLINIIWPIIWIATPIWGKQPKLNISGFGDFYYLLSADNHESDEFKFGQVEIDLGTSMEKKIGIDIALAYDPEFETFGLGVFTVDLHLFGNDGSHFRRGGLDHSGIILGQFDVPFGIDWQVYPSIDRKLVSAPLVVESTHNAWNDYGIQAYIGHGIFDLTLFTTNGFGYETGYNAGVWQGYNGVGYSGDDPDIITTDIKMKLSCGGRLSFKPHHTSEIGTSFAGFFRNNNRLDMAMLGADAQFNYNSFHFKSEVITHWLGLDGDNRLLNGGFYVQSYYEFNRFFLVGRYNLFSVGMNDINNAQRFDAGLGWVVLDGAEIRVEHQFSGEKDEDPTFFQMVVGFPQVGL